MSTHIDLSPDECSLLLSALRPPDAIVLNAELEDAARAMTDGFRLRIHRMANGQVGYEVTAALKTTHHIGNPHDIDPADSSAQWCGGPDPEMVAAAVNPGFVINPPVITAAPSAPKPTGPPVSYSFTIHKSPSLDAIRLEAQRRCEAFFDTAFTITSLDVESVEPTEQINQPKFRANVYAESAS